jgi:integrase/recombinase XerD
MENGENIDEKLPYLSKYLGHNSIHESLYYYHQAAEAFKIIHDRDKTSNIVIPEVKDNEE